MSKIHKITTPLTKETILALHAGYEVEISGTLYAARDVVHKKFFELLNKGEPLPINIKNQIIYYVGPSPTPPGHIIGSAGPTTANRMDMYTPKLISFGLAGMIGKGPRNQSVKNACKEYKAVYFAATGGAAALLSQKISKVEMIAYPELGPEALQKLEVKDFPALVINDAYGKDFYEIAQKEWAKK